MKAQIVHTRVSEARREEYLEAWDEWSGLLLPMGIETELLQSREDPGEFVELTWFGPGEEAALADDRLARVNDRLQRTAESRTGARKLYREWRR